ncbi:uncharacterized protein At4g14100-like [Prosopis cineraria]|uniref:uncharacterized protein At4g14100-like n=1 Tax=Prosopis cineraria TaxID=364024 RepID=UPI00240ECC90|nr:uncharacterized protein At4g14100-like [Prosopis cineraria]
MASSVEEAISFSALLLLLFSSSFLFPSKATTNPTGDPTPTPWPLQFHSFLFMNNTGKLQKVDLWYDWPNGRNFNIIQNQLGELKYDLEWDNGTSYIYTLDPSNQKCRILHFPVGILRPNWLDGATYLGKHYVDNFLCNLWQKVDFIWYYEDVLTHRPVKWIFYTGMIAHVMTFEVGAVLEDEKWQAPVYCFAEAEGGEIPLFEATVHSDSLGKLMRGTSNAVDAM